MDKDKVLPLDHILSGSIGPLFTSGWEAGIEAQRDADWKRMEPLIEAVEAYLAWAEGEGREVDGAGRYGRLFIVLAQLGLEARP